MSALPKSITSLTREFQEVCVDYQGQTSVLKYRSRGLKMTIALFIGMSTKAFHLKFASKLSTNACIACLKVFNARRGFSKRIHSDNGTNLFGARKTII